MTHNKGRKIEILKEIQAKPGTYAGAMRKICTTAYAHGIIKLLLMEGLVYAVYDSRIKRVYITKPGEEYLEHTK